MKAARDWVDENSQSGAFDIVPSFREAEVLVAQIQADAINSLKARPEGVLTSSGGKGPVVTRQWIPVHVALPKCGQEVFFARLGSVHRGHFYTHNAPHFSSGHMSYWHPREKITHWMPSPTPEPPASE